MGNFREGFCFKIIATDVKGDEYHWIVCCPSLTLKLNMMEATGFVKGLLTIFT